jgi:radical SAM-linked protein
MSYMYRIKYSKDGPLKYVSHLNLNTLFCRTLRRARIPVELTQGFNPRFKISFGPALPLGFAGWEEVLDINLIREQDSEQIKEIINQYVPVGLKIREVMPISEKEGNLSSILRYAIYIVELHLGEFEINFSKEDVNDYFKTKIGLFLEQKNILIEKNTKKGYKEVDLRPYIENMEIISIQDNLISILLTVDIQYKGSINPVLIINEFLNGLGKKDIYTNSIIRKGFNSNKKIVK